MLTDARSCYTTSHYQASGICYKNYQNESQPNILFDSLDTTKAPISTSQLVGVFGIQRCLKNSLGI